MGCTTCGASSGSSKASLGINRISNIELDKWNSRQINLAKKHFMAGLGSHQKTLDYSGFERVFPLIKTLPKEVRLNAFKVFDQDKSKDINFKEFCLTLSTLIHDPINEKLTLMCKLFDLDADEKIGIDDMRIVLYSRATLQRKEPNYKIGADEVKNIEHELKKLYSSNLPQNSPANKPIFTFSEFKNVLPAYVEVDQVLEIFQIIPSPAQEREIIQKVLKTEKMQDGDTYYVISNGWYRAWNLFVNHCSDTTELQGYKSNNSGIFDQSTINVYHPRKFGTIKPKGSLRISIEASESEDHKNSAGRPGEIDNSDLCGPLPGSLKDGLMYKIDYALLSKQAWKNLVEWYGGGPEFPRKIIITETGVPQVELYPPILYISLCGSNGHVVKESITTLVLSSKLKMGQVHRMVSEKYDKVASLTRLWYRLRRTYDWLLVNDMEKSVEDLELLDSDYLMLEVKIGGSWPRDLLDPNNSISIATGPEVGDDVDIYVETERTWKKGVIILATQDKYKIQTEGENALYTVSKYSSYIASAGTHTGFTSQFLCSTEIQSKLAAEFKPLLNLGNSCYMSAVLQCLTHTPLLNTYLQSRLYKGQINPQFIYGSLVGYLADFVEYYMKHSDVTSALRRFKTVVGKILPAFKPSIQHDAQEFLSAVLERMDMELTPIIEEGKENTVISAVDTLFSGKIVTALKCSRCHHESTKDETFYHLSLPIPETVLPEHYPIL